MNGNIKISSMEEVNQYDSEKNGWVERYYIGWSQGKLLRQQLIANRYTNNF